MSIQVQHPENDNPEFINDMDKLRELKRKRKNRYPSINNLDSKLITDLNLPEVNINWDKVDSVNVNLNGIRILRVMEPFWDKKAEVYSITMINDELSYQDKSEENPINVNTFGIFKGIKKGEDLDITNYPLYAFKKGEDGILPEQLICKFLIMESDQKDREIGDILDEIKKSDVYNRAVDTLRKYPKPEIGMITIVTDLVFSSITKALKTNKDDQMMLSYAGFHKYIDRLGWGEHTSQNKNAVLTYTVDLPPYVASQVKQQEIPMIGEGIPLIRARGLKYPQ